MTRNRKVKIGDVFQILTSQGISYGQVTHIHPKYDYVICVFETIYSQIPNDFQKVVSDKIQFKTAFLINDAVKKGLFNVVANQPVLSANEKFPIFRGTNNFGDGDGTIWWFWDGNKEWKVARNLSPDEKKYPQSGLISAPLLIERIEKGYRDEIDYV